MSTFDQFENGALIINDKQISLCDIAWSPHAAFEGVALKHLITSSQTKGTFSYHLVRIDPSKRIGWHTHETQLETHEIIEGSGYCTIGSEKYTYRPGTISVIPTATNHEVVASQNGLYLFAKFLPALC
ncbi:MAG: cupin domain-containing protein [Raoultibacter sp.]|jgi:quercetin dioxygenase-like cupin family protein